jgi:glycine/D-amino acid oxidase-like deaminating enzyme
MSGPIVIVGAGIAGVAAAYHLAVRHGCTAVSLIEAEQPLSMTSDKSTEAYRNWWPGPDGAMTQFMNRSIDLLEALARDTGNAFNMNRRGYLFASADASRADWLISIAETAAQHGGGAARVHGRDGSSYDPSPDAAFDAPLAGADILTDPALIRRHFPYLSDKTCLVAHARRAGWLSAQQLGMAMLERARAAGTFDRDTVDTTAVDGNRCRSAAEHLYAGGDAGVQMLRGRATSVAINGGRVDGVTVERAGGDAITLSAAHVILAAGPLAKGLAGTAGLDLPLFAECHHKISWPDSAHILPRTAPMLIWLDPQHLPWKPDERDMLAADASTRWLTEEFPWGAHGRPDGRGPGGTVLALYNYKNAPTDVVFPLPEPAHYGEITLRGMATMVPGLQVYVDRGVRPYIDGGYYVKTRDNRPLIGPCGIAGLYLSCGYSGFGIMASQAGADLLAAHVLGHALPAYADAFALARFDSAAYRAQLDTWGDGGQL